VFCRVFSGSRLYISASQEHCSSHLSASHEYLSPFLGNHPQLSTQTVAHSLTSPPERLVIYCQTTSVSAAHATHCATYCTPCRPLLRAFSGWIQTPPPTNTTRWNTTPPDSHQPRTSSLSSLAGPHASTPNEAVTVQDKVAPRLLGIAIP